MDLYRIRVQLEGGAGGLKVATHYVSDIAVGRAAVGTFWSGVRDGLPSSLTIVTEAEGDIIDSETGLITGAWTEGSVSPLPGAGGEFYAAGVGACVTWRTAAVIEGRRVRGRTFIVPLAREEYDTDGTLTTAGLTRMRNSAAGYAASPATFVFSRPRDVPSLPGSAVPITSGTVTDKVAYLSSRRQ